MTINNYYGKVFYGPSGMYSGPTTETIAQKTGSLPTPKLCCSVVCLL